LTEGKTPPKSATIMVKDDKDNIVDELEDSRRVYDYYEKTFKEKIAIMPAVVDTDEIEIDLIIGEDSFRVLGMRCFQFFQVDDNGEVTEESDGDDEAKEESAGDSKEAVKEGKDNAAEGDAAGGKSTDDQVSEDDASKDETIEDEVYDMIVTDLSRSEAGQVKGKQMLKVQIAKPKSIDDDEAGDEGESCKDDEDDAEGEHKADVKKGSKGKVKPAATKPDGNKKYWLTFTVYYSETDEGLPEITGAVLAYDNAPQKKIAFLPNDELG